MPSGRRTSSRLRSNTWCDSTVITNQTDGAALAALQREFMQRHAELSRVMLERKPGETLTPVVVPEERDRRFSAPEWVQSPVHDYLRQAYLLNSDYLLRAVQVLACDDERMKQRMVFATRCAV